MGQNNGNPDLVWEKNNAYTFSGIIKSKILKHFVLYHIGPNIGPNSAHVLLFHGEIFERTLFSQITLKNMFVMLKFCDWSMIYLHQ